MELTIDYAEMAIRILKGGFEIMATDISQDNCFEWLTNKKVGTVTFSQKRFVSKLKKYAEEYPDIEIVAENEDGSICAHVPVSWFKFSPPRKGREFTEEEKATAAERLAKAREEKRNGRGRQG